MTLRFLRCLHQTEPHFASTDHAFVDGYSFGDRLLEGVIFEVRIAPCGKAVTAKVTPDCEAYFADLNTEKWVCAAVQFALQNDLFQAERDGDHEAVLYDDSKPHSEQMFSCPKEIEIDGVKVVG